MTFRLRPDLAQTGPSTGRAQPAPALPTVLVVATCSGKQLTQKDKADSGVQFITPRAQGRVSS